MIPLLSSTSKRFFTRIQCTSKLMSETSQKTFDFICVYMCCELTGTVMSHWLLKQYMTHSCTRLEAIKKRTQT